MTISELCDQVLVYLQSINISNKNNAYTPSGTLANGATLNTYSASPKHGTAKNVVETVYTMV